jgi:hypothetical protein
MMDDDEEMKEKDGGREVEVEVGGSCLGVRPFWVGAMLQC